MEKDNYKLQDEGFTLNKKSHRHNFKKEKNYLICSCGKKILALENSDKDGLLKGKKQNGINYSVRKDRRRYFFPDEWNNFIKLINNRKHRFFFIVSLHTGGRIMEILNLKHEDIDIDRETIKFSIVKQRKAKKDFYAMGKTRGFFVSSELIKEYKSYIRGQKINLKDYIFLDNDKLPVNYGDLDNSERKKYYSSKVVSYSKMLKTKIKKSKIKDYWNFSHHNIRKTYGMWMRTFNFEMSELCYRMGHDIDTYLAHYGSSLIFTEEERRKIQRIMGDVK